MHRESEPMRKLHKIREKLYKEEKNLSSKERIVKAHREAEEFIKKYGIKIKRAVPAA
ncbi:MAG: hypothetical protein ABIH71_01930 [Candidatus Omnitrophota bacterium]